MSSTLMRANPRPFPRLPAKHLYLCALLLGKAVSVDAAALARDGP